MFDRINRSWDLTKQSWNVLRADKTLVIFPIFSTIALFAVIASFALPTFIWIDSLTPEHRKAIFEGGNTSVVGLIITFAFYFVAYFVMTYFNVALAGAAMERFAGREASLGSGIAVANSRLLQILAWAGLSATVGMILKALEERAGILGKIVLRLIGVAWAVGTYFVVPILAVEGLGPVDSIKRSVSLLKKSWGEAALTRFGSGLVFGLMTLGIVVVTTAIVVFAAVNNLVILAVAVGALGFCAVVVLSLIATTLQAILQVAVYSYAANGEVPRGFDATSLRGMFAPKKKKK